jgi:hypothetical protein
VTSHALKKPVQVRLEPAAREFLVQTAEERGQTQSEVVTEALNCLREQQVEALMEEGYRTLGESQQAISEAGLTAALPIIPQ